MYPAAREGEAREGRGWNDCLGGSLAEDAVAESLRGGSDGTGGPGQSVEPVKQS